MSHSPKAEYERKTVANVCMQMVYKKQKRTELKEERKTQYNRQWIRFGAFDVHVVVYLSVA